MENELNLSSTSVQLALLCLIDLPSHSRRAISPFKKNCTRAYGSSIRINQFFRVVIKQAIEVRVRKEKEVSWYGVKVRNQNRGVGRTFYGYNSCSVLRSTSTGLASGGIRFEGPGLPLRQEMMHAELGCLEIAYFFLTPGTKNSSAACYYSVLEFEQQIKVRAKANSEFSREEVRFRTAHDELLNPSPSESVSVRGIEAKDDSTEKLIRDYEQSPAVVMATSGLRDQGGVARLSQGRKKCNQREDFIARMNHMEACRTSSYGKQIEAVMQEDKDSLEGKRLQKLALGCQTQPFDLVSLSSQFVLPVLQDWLCSRAAVFLFLVFRIKVVAVIESAYKLALTSKPAHNRIYY
uniref:Uncharacterized protein n=1 Tax=Brassica oleracea var. oleracea TaxID=109376 RepID=A0A0D2ZQF1_BRAOL